eukprot:365420-Chlamydomonas_euryale.AAC.14
MHKLLLTCKDLRAESSRASSSDSWPSATGPARPTRQRPIPHAPPPPSATIVPGDGCASLASATGCTFAPPFPFLPLVLGGVPGRGAAGASALLGLAGGLSLSLWWELRMSDASDVLLDCPDMSEARVPVPMAVNPGSYFASNASSITARNSATQMYLPACARAGGGGKGRGRWSQCRRPQWERARGSRGAAACRAAMSEQSRAQGGRGGTQQRTGRPCRNTAGDRRP